MRRISYVVTAVVLLASAFLEAGSAKRQPTEKPGPPPKSGFYDFFKLREGAIPGVGAAPQFTCVVDSSTQPAEYAGNSLVDCDAEIPHNETTIVVNPDNADHAVAGYHSYQLSFVGATVVAHVIGTASVTMDGGESWQEIIPPITPYQFTGDPALAFDGNGRVYFANIADHEGPGGNFTAPSVVVAHSDDGGFTWSKPVTVAKGRAAITRGKSAGPEIFNDKEFVAADKSSNRVYVTWARFEQFFNPVSGFIRVPIVVSYSDDGQHWSPPQEISGFSPHCSAALFGQPNECDLNQFSYPAVASDGTVYVSFENFNTEAENQVLIVKSTDGGPTWSSPVKIDTLFDINFPTNDDQRDTLTGCRFRYSAKANTAVDPNDPDTVYVVWADNRNGTETQTNTDVFLARSTDGSDHWTVHVVDDTANDQFYPWVDVAPDGRVDVGYMDRWFATGTNQDQCLYGFTVSRVTFGGMVSTVKQRVDTGFSDVGHSRWFSSPDNPASRFIGDYNGLAVGPDGATWSLWTDHRNVVENPPSPARNHGQHEVAAHTNAP